MEATNIKKKNIIGDINFQNLDEKISLPVEYLNKQLDYVHKIADATVELFSHWISVPDDKLVIIKSLARDYHYYFAIDDIQDRSALRNSTPSAHTIFGVTNVIIAFDYVFWCSLGKILELNHPKAVSIFVEEWRRGMAGQGLEICWREKFLCPTEEEWYQMTALKSGTWIVLIIRLMQLFDSTDINAEELAYIMGLYFQINDDYNNLTNPEFFRTKGFCDDISEGRCSFPIVHAINSHPEEKEIIIDILRQRTKDILLKKQLLSILEKCGSFEYNRNKIQKMKLIFVQKINKLGGNPLLREYVELFSKTNEL